jgi:hypothetical protein
MDVSRTSLSHGDRTMLRSLLMTLRISRKSSTETSPRPQQSPIECSSYAERRRFNAVDRDGGSRGCGGLRNLARHTPGDGIRTGLPPDRRLGEGAAERGLPDAQCLGARQQSKQALSRPVLYSRRRICQRLWQRLGAGRRQEHRAKQHDLRHDELPPWRVGLLRPSRAFRGGIRPRLREPGLSGPDRRAAMDQTQHRRVWRRSGSYNHCRQLVWRGLGNRVDGFTFDQGTFPTWHRRKRRGRPTGCQSDSGKIWNGAG